MPQLTQHFHSREFDCHDGTPVPRAAIPALKELCEHMLEPLRAKYGPCKILSGYRTRAWNASTPGSARYSQHIYDDTPGSVAADLRFERGTPAQWARSARWRFGFKSVWRRKGRGGVGQYNNAAFVHVDSGPRRDWSG
jgi:uncharacterized protein YcbK (DUF882 family)